MKRLSALLLLLSSMGLFSQTTLSGIWFDSDHPEKEVHMYVREDDKVYGTNPAGDLVFKALSYDFKNEVFKGFIVSPENGKAFPIEIEQAGPDIFTFEIKQFVVKKKFKFRRKEGTR